MKNAFRILGLDERLVVADAALRDAFREAGRLAHPDGGGSEADFAALREAMDTLSSPGRRLRQWLELRGILVETRGTVDAGLMDLFVEIGEAAQRAEALIRKREESKSALALAMLERESQLCREQIEQALGKVEKEIAAECSKFELFETSGSSDFSDALRTLRNLGFLEKWRVSLRSLFPRLL